MSAIDSKMINIVSNANCKQLVDRGEITAGLFRSKRRNSQFLAKMICTQCMVEKECLAWALENPTRTKGEIWGGMTDKERQRTKE